MIVPRFTFFTCNFGDQITEIFRSGHDCVGASSARTPWTHFHLLVGGPEGGAVFGVGFARS